MSSDEGTVYMIRDHSADGDDEWVSPEPANDVITDAVVDGTDLAADDIDDIEDYVDLDELRAVVVEGTEQEITFTVEEFDVTVTKDGTIDID